MKHKALISTREKSPTGLILSLSTTGLLREEVMLSSCRHSYISTLSWAGSPVS